MIINDENYTQKLYEFTDNKISEIKNKYGEKEIDAIIEKLSSYGLVDEKLDDKSFFIQIITGFIIFWKDPKNHKSIIDEFMEKFYIEENTKNKLEGIREFLNKTIFPIEIKKMGNRYIGKFIDFKTEEIYYIDLTYNNLYKSIENHVRKVLVKGIIYKYGDFYRFLGILIMSSIFEALLTEEFIEIFFKVYIEKKLEKIESKKVDEKITLEKFIKSYTSNMVDGMYIAMGFKKKIPKNEKIEKIVRMVTENTRIVLNKLTPEAIDELKFIYKNGVSVKYTKIMSMYGDDRNILWDHYEMKTTTGMLRLYGLVIVGTMEISGRHYKVVKIPKDVMESLKNFI